MPGPSAAALPGNVGRGSPQAVGSYGPLAAGASARGFGLPGPPAPAAALAKDGAVVGVASRAGFARPLAPLAAAARGVAPPAALFAPLRRQPVYLPPRGHRRHQLACRA